METTEWNINYIQPQTISSATQETISFASKFQPTFSILQSPLQSFGLGRNENNEHRFCQNRTQLITTHKKNFITVLPLSCSIYHVALCCIIHLSHHFNFNFLVFRLRFCAFISFYLTFSTLIVFSMVYHFVMQERGQFKSKIKPLESCKTIILLQCRQSCFRCHKTQISPLK